VYPANRRDVPSVRATAARRSASVWGDPRPSIEGLCANDDAYLRATGVNGQVLLVAATPERAYVPNAPEPTAACPSLPLLRSLP